MLDIKTAQTQEPDRLNNLIAHVERRRKLIPHLAGTDELPELIAAVESGIDQIEFALDE